MPAAVDTTRYEMWLGLYPSIPTYGAIVLSKIYSHNHTGSSSSSIRRIWWSLQRVKLVYFHGWPELVVCCRVDFRVLCFYIGQLQSGNWMLTTTFTAVMCGKFFEKVIVACSVGAQSCPYLAVSTATGILVHKDTSSCRHSKSLNSLASLKLVKTLCCIVPNTFLSNHVPFHASTINNYQRLTPVTMPPTLKKVYILLTDFKLSCDTLVSQASPILFRSADRFQIRHTEEGSGDLGPLYVDLYGNLNRVNEIAEHIIRADFVTWTRSL